MAWPTDVMHIAKFPNEDIRTIITSVATLFNLNVIVPDTLTGTTTLQLHDVTWQQIFKYVLDPIGYTYTIDGTGPNAVILIQNKADIAVGADGNQSSNSLIRPRPTILRNR